MRWYRSNVLNFALKFGSETKVITLIKISLLTTDINSIFFYFGDEQKLLLGETRVHPVLSEGEIKSQNLYVQMFVGEAMLGGRL